MEDCSQNFVCRAKEIKLEVFVGVSEKIVAKKCCCDFRKEIPGTSHKLPTVIAPKCVYNQAGYINQWSLVEAGTDLGCMATDELMTYDIGNGKFDSVVLIISK